MFGFYMVWFRSMHGYVPLYFIQEMLQSLKRLEKNMYNFYILNCLLSDSKVTWYWRNEIHKMQVEEGCQKKICSFANVLRILMIFQGGVCAIPFHSTSLFKIVKKLTLKNVILGEMKKSLVQLALHPYSRWYWVPTWKSNHSLFFNYFILYFFSSWTTFQPFQ